MSSFHERIVAHPIFRASEARRNEVWGRIVDRANARADRFFQREEARYLAARKKAQAIREEGHRKGREATQAIEEAAYSAAAAALAAEALPGKSEGGAS